MSWSTSQDNLTFMCCKLKSDFPCPFPLEGKGKSNTHFSMWHFRMLLHVLVPLALGTRGQQLPLPRVHLMGKELCITCPCNFCLCPDSFLCSYRMTLSLPKIPPSKSATVSVFFGWIHSMRILLCLGYLGQRYVHKCESHPLSTPRKHEALPTHCQNCLYVPTNGCRAPWMCTDPNLPLKEPLLWQRL